MPCLGRARKPNYNGEGLRLEFRREDEWNILRHEGNLVDLRAMGREEEQMSDVGVLGPSSEYKIRDRCGLGGTAALGGAC